ncbi:unnamed protein product [Prunus brigantina]
MRSFMYASYIEIKKPAIFFWVIVSSPKLTSNILLDDSFNKMIRLILVPDLLEHCK